MSSETREGLLWLWIIVLVLISVVVSGRPVFALPHVYWNPVTGDDANSGLNKPSAVQTLPRCRELLNLSDTDNDTGFKWDSADTAVLLLPENFDILQLTMNRAKDKAEQHPTRVVVPGHGQVPDEDIEDSNDAGFRIRYKHTWETFTNMNGLQEREIGRVPSVEIY